MSRLYPILAVLWASLFALFLAVWSEWLKGPHALETVQKILSSNLRWLGAALLVFTVATLLSYFKSKDQESRPKEAGGDSVGVRDSHAGGDIAGRDVAGRDLAGRDVVGRDAAGHDIVGRDVVGRDVAGRDIINQYVIGVEQTIPRATGNASVPTSFGRLALTSSAALTKSKSWLPQSSGAASPSRDCAERAESARPNSRTSSLRF